MRDEDIPFGEPMEPFAGLTHAEVLKLELPADRYLVDDLIPAGAVGTIAGVPETHKSFLAQAIGVGIASGEGEILGRRVARQARVGYFWQDDSTREEVERVKLYERVHASSPDLPLWWFLNVGLELPRDVDRLRATIDALRLELVILDSFYNVVPGVDLKDENAERIIALLKREIADTTGCTVLPVDHMPWATDTNRSRLRAYGGVFKNAATRFGIYIDAQGKKLYVEARGNNIRGFKKAPAYWDEDALELRLVDRDGQPDHEAKVEQRAEAVLSWLIERPGAYPTSAVRTGAGGRSEITDEALELLKARDDVRDLARDGGTWSGRRGAARYWIATIHAGSNQFETSSRTAGTMSDDDATGVIDEQPRPVRPALCKRDEVGRDDVLEEEIECLAEVSREAQA